MCASDHRPWWEFIISQAFHGLWFRFDTNVFLQEYVGQSFQIKIRQEELLAEVKLFSNESQYEVKVEISLSRNDSCKSKKKSILYKGYNTE